MGYAQENGILPCVRSCKNDNMVIVPYIAAFLVLVYMVATAGRAALLGLKLNRLAREKYPHRAFYTFKEADIGDPDILSLLAKFRRAYRFAIISIPLVIILVGTVLNCIYG